MSYTSTITTTACTTLTTTATTTRSSSLDWSWLDKLEFSETTQPSTVLNGTTYTSKFLNNTLLSSSLFNATWESRIAFVKTVVEDVVGACRKDEELSILFLGSRTFLVEYLIVSGLIENGYRYLTLFFIDPVYGDFFEKGERELLFTVFQQQIDKAYRKQWQGFPAMAIHFLARASFVKEYFSTNHPQVLLVESMHPHGDFFTAMQKLKIPEPKKPEESFLGGHLVPPEYANAIMFMPRLVYQQLEAEDATFNHTLPFATLKGKDSWYCFDCGVKIGEDGSVFVSVTGLQEYSGGKLNEEEIQDKVKLVVGSEIKKIKANDSQRKLTQKEITSLLVWVEDGLGIVMGVDLTFFFTADYALDRAELITYLSNRTSQHYRRNIIIQEHPKETPKITINTL